MVIYEKRGWIHIKEIMVHQQDYSKQKNVPLTADDVIIFTTYHIYYDFLAIALTEHVAIYPM